MCGVFFLSRVFCPPETRRRKGERQLERRLPCVCASLSLLPHNIHSHKSRVLKARALSSPPKGRTTTTTTPEAFQYYRERERERKTSLVSTRAEEREKRVGERYRFFFCVGIFSRNVAGAGGATNARDRRDDERLKEGKRHLRRRRRRERR